MKSKHATYIQDLAQVIVDLKSTQSAIDFLEGILTPKEVQELSVRLQIVKKLKTGESQRKIASDLGVGIATITRGSKELQNGRFIYV